MSAWSTRGLVRMFRWDKSLLFVNEYSYLPIRLLTQAAAGLAFRRDGPPPATDQSKSDDNPTRNESSNTAEERCSLRATFAACAVVRESFDGQRLIKNY